MRKLLLGLSVAALASTSIAQIPMSEYVRTYSFTHTRGYYFQAPTDFTVKTLQVPDETNKGSYAVAIYKLSAAPPVFSSTVAAKPTFYGFSKDAHQCLTVPKGMGDYKKGDWFVVLGAAGPATGNLFNSYGAAANPSSILGVPIASGLRRCGMQLNIAPTKGVGGIFSSGGSIARVKVVVASTTKSGAASCDYCPSSNGAVTLDTASLNPAVIGKELKLRARAGGSSNTGGFLAFGLLKGKVPVPGFGTLCVLGIGGVVPFPAVATTPVAAATNLSLGTIPAATPSGVSVYFQLALKGTGATPHLSNGLQITTGN